jgi:hypothetical protein
MHQRGPHRPRLGARLAAFLEWGSGRDALIEVFDRVVGIPPRAHRVDDRNVIHRRPVPQSARRDSFAPDCDDDAADDGAGQCDAK